jgi:organic radical activating enzyme
MKINKGQSQLNSRSKKLRFELNRGNGNLLGYIKNRILWHLNPRLHHVSKYPLHVDIELSSLCDLNCPMCYTTTEEFKEKVGRGLLDFELYKKIIDESSKFGLYSIRLSWRGEPFLHPKIYDMIKYAKDNGIKEVSTLTHGGKLDEKNFEKLIDLGLDWLTISFDGMKETYEKIRYPLKFDEAVEKIKQYQEIKKRKGVVKPVIKVQTVWPAISKNPDEFYDVFNPITDQIAANPLIDYLQNDTDIVYEENFTCPQLWERLVITSDGSAVLCANDEMGSYSVGDAKTQSIFDIWHGKKLEEAREIHLKHMGVNKIDACKHCYLPRKTERESAKLDNHLVNIDNYINRDQKVGK